MSPSDSPQEPPDRLNRPSLKLVPSTANAQTDNSSKHIICLVILPFNRNQSFDYYKEVMLPALRVVFEKSPCYWQVIPSDSNIVMDMESRGKNVKVYIVDISDDNPNMIFELGGIVTSERGKDSLVFALCREGTESKISNMRNVPIIQYPIGYGQHSIGELEKVVAYQNAIEDVVKALKKNFQRPDIRSLNSGQRRHYLSPLILSELKMDSQTAHAFAEVCETMEAFRDANAREISKQIRRRWDFEVTPEVITGYQKAIRVLLKKL